MKKIDNNNFYNRIIDSIIKMSLLDSINKNKIAVIRLNKERKKLTDNEKIEGITIEVTDDIYIWYAYINGPKDTPYENGLFLFHAYLPHNYPQVEPKVLIITTGNGKVRFNPNLYNCGKVCLSLLGTWSGHESEKWNPKTSTFLQVLISIQSLILIDQPFFNEPGYERQINSPIGQTKSKLYNNNIQYENIRWGMIDQILNPPIGYEEVVKNHFKLKYNDIINLIDKWILESDEINKPKMIDELTKLKELLDNFL